MIQELRGKIYPTGIGSLPYKEAKPACDEILKNFHDVPFWPQLVKRSFLENMYVQFSEKFPGVVVDPDEKRIYIDTAKDLMPALEELYGRFLETDLEYFSISRDHAEGLYELVERVKASAVKPKFLKGQIIGPVSFGLTVADEKRRSIAYNPELKEALVKTISMRARWQIRKLKETQTPCILFIDEPYLASIGSSYINLKREDAFSQLNEVIRSIHDEGALCGIHCCGNTDWGLLLTTDVDVINFDAYIFADNLALYPVELKRFLERGGMLAWGIVPSTQDILKESDEGLIEKLNRAVEALAKKGIKKETIFDSMMITPSCGLGLNDEYLARMIIEHTGAIADKIRKTVKR